MRRIHLIAALAGAVAALVPAFAVAAPAAPTRAAAPKAWVKLMDCSRADQSAVFYARMQRLPGTRRMWMRYTLLERRGGARFAPVRAEGLGRWRRSRKGVRDFGYRQEVRNLSGNGVYRALVEYRWYDKRGELVRQVGRRSSPCTQFTASPNVRVLIVGAKRGRVSGVVRYSVRVANTGPVAAAGVVVSLAVDGAALDTRTATLAPGKSRVVSFRGPACTSSVSAIADPGGSVSESDEGDNAQTLACADLPGR
jgi:hypothetical protein